MKSTKTILAVAILIAGLTYAVGSAHPDSFTRSHCCGPQPEDIRTYRVPIFGSDPSIIIPKVEGSNGFLITDVRTNDSVKVFQDTGEGPEEILWTINGVHLNPVPGFPLVPGSTITVTGFPAGWATIIGYVY